MMTAQKKYPATLRELNACLEAARIPIALSAGDAATLKMKFTRDAVIEAFDRAGSDPASRKKVLTWLKEVGLYEGGSPADDMPPAAPMPDIGRGEDELPSGLPTDEGVQIRHGKRRNIHVYGQKAALCWEADTTKGDAATVALDAALSTAPRAYDWSKKIRLQLTIRELPVVAAVLLGQVERCEFKNHGAEKNKGFTLENQTPPNGKGKVFVRVFAANEMPRAVPMEAVDVFRVSLLVLEQLHAQAPTLDATSLHTALRALSVRERGAGMSPPQPGANERTTR